MFQFFKLVGDDGRRTFPQSRVLGLSVAKANAAERATLKLAHESGLYIALNLLTFPGITDREGEVAAISELIGEFGVHQVQTRNLALDPEQYLAVARETAHKSDPIGIAAMIKQLKKDHPKLVIGNYSRGLNERGEWEKPSGLVATG